MHSFYETNDQFLQLTPEELADFKGDFSCGPYVVDEKTGETVPELRVVDEAGGTLSLIFHELTELDRLLGQLYVLRRHMADGYELRLDVEHPGFYPLRGKLKLVD